MVEGSIGKRCENVYRCDGVIGRSMYTFVKIFVRWNGTMCGRGEVLCMYANKCGKLGFGGGGFSYNPKRYAICV